MKDTAAISVNSFKNTVFLWEVIITIIVFGSAYFILKKYKEHEQKSKKNNSKYNTGE